MAVFTILAILELLTIMGCLAISTKVCAKQYPKNSSRQMPSLRSNREENTDIQRNCENTQHSDREPENSANSSNSINSRRVQDSMRVQRKKKPAKKPEPEKSSTQGIPDDDSNEIEIVMENVEKRQAQSENRLLPPGEWKNDQSMSKSRTGRDKSVTFASPKKKCPKKKAAAASEPPSASLSASMKSEKPQRSDM